MCIVGLCNLILYIGYILYIVKSLCDINGYVFTIERERRTGHPRVLSHGRSADTRRAMVFRGPASPECGAQRRFPVVMSSTTENARSLLINCRFRGSIRSFIRRRSIELSRMYITLNFALFFFSFISASHSFRSFNVSLSRVISRGCCDFFVVKRRSRDRAICLQEPSRDSLLRYARREARSKDSVVVRLGEAYERVISSRDLGQNRRESNCDAT